MCFNQELIVVIVGAFAGAFFAFLLVRIVELLKSIHNRKVIHFNALVRIEREGQEQLDSIGCNIYEIEQMESSFSRAKADRNLPILMNQPHHLIPILDVMDKLTNVDMLNKILFYNTDVRRINDDITKLKRIYDYLATGLMQKLFTPDSYMSHVEGMINTVGDLKLFLEEFKQDTIELISAAVVLERKDKPMFSRILSPFSKSRNLSELSDEIEAQIKITKADMKKVAEESGRKLDKIYEKKKQ